MFSQEPECPGIWWFSRKENRIRFLDIVTWYETLCENSLWNISVSTKHFYKKTLSSAIWTTSGKEKLMRFLEKMISWKALFGNFRRELCSSLCSLMKQVGTFLCLHLFNTSSIVNEVPRTIFFLRENFISTKSTKRHV